MKKITVVVLGLITLGLITACQPVESITVDEISGDWQDESGTSFMFLNEDGTFSWSDPSDSVFGQWELEGATLTLHGDDESPTCAGGSASIQVEFIEEDKFRSLLIKEDCPEETSGEGWDIWLRAST